MTRRVDRAALVSEPRQPRRFFTWHDAIKVGISACATLALTWLTFTPANKASFFTSGGLVIIGVVVAIMILISVDRFRAYSERLLNDTHQHLHGELKRQLDQVHASVAFVPAEGKKNGTSTRSTRGYDVATAAVHRAQRRIYVMGDYNPPASTGPSLDKPPASRSEYLREIETTLEKHIRMEPKRRPAPKFVYHRFIQRPPDIYQRLSDRAAGNRVTLTQADMVGDEQAYEHCKNVLRLAHGAHEELDIEIRVIPFLPNCPSVLLVDNRDLQFTIPTRLDELGGVDTIPMRGLHGVLVMEDRRGGAQVCEPFDQLFRTLSAVSIMVINVDGGPPPEQRQRRLLGPRAPRPQA
jgi:hypothetical protein